MSELIARQKHTRLRIVGKPDDARGYMLLVHDADTGEKVMGIARIVLTLDPNQVNYADVTYYTGKDEVQSVTLKDIEVDVVAYVGGESYA